MCKCLSEKTLCNQCVERKSKGLCIDCGLCKSVEDTALCNDCTPCIHSTKSTCACIDCKNDRKTLLIAFAHIKQPCKMCEVETAVLWDEQPMCNKCKQ